MKRILSLILAISLLLSMAVFTAGAEDAAEYNPEGSYTVSADTPTCEEAILACGGSLDEVQTIYFQCPEDWKNEYNVLEGTDYAQVCVYWASGIGTAWPNGAEQKWVGYKATLVDAQNRIYSAVVPTTRKQSPAYVVWNNGVNGGMDPEDPIFYQARQLMNTNVQGLEEEEEDSLPEGTPDPDSMDGCIAILNPDVSVENALTGFDNYGADWYVYYGDGCYGSYAEDSDSFVSVDENCLNPAHYENGVHVGYHETINTVVLLGDANDDGIVNIQDYAIVQQAADGSYTGTLKQLAADVNFDGEITASDANMIKDYLSMKEVPSPIGEVVDVSEYDPIPDATEAPTEAPTEPETEAPTEALPLDPGTIYFDANSTGWTLTSKSRICFYIYNDEGNVTEFGDKYSRGVKDADLDLFGFNLADNDVTLEEGKQYKIIFSVYNGGDQTGALLMDTTCLGHVAYCDGTEYENAVDSTKKALAAFWRDMDASVVGPSLEITSTGKVIGTCPAQGMTPYTIFTTFLTSTGPQSLANARLYNPAGDQAMLDSIGEGLGLTKNEIYDALAETETESDWSFSDSTLPGTPLHEHTAAAPVQENVVPSTCKVAGSYDEVVYCSECGEEISRTAKDLPLAEHTAGPIVEEAAVAATCKTEGSYDLVVYCSVCGDEMSRTHFTTEKIAHTAKAPVRENVVNATCKTPGGYDEVVYCSVCGDEISRQHRTIAVTAHTPSSSVRENVVPATSDADGSYDEVVYCSVCGDELSRTSKVIPKTSHVPGDEVIENNIAPTCRLAGSYDKVVYCTDCGTEISRDTVVVPKLQHTAAAAVHENYIAPTCSAVGSYDEVVYCSVCGEEISRERKTVAMTAHVPGQPVHENEIASTCNAQGSYNKVVYCSVCGEETGRSLVITPRADHTNAAVAEVPATYTQTGVKEHFRCSVCGKLFADLVGETEVTSADLVIPVLSPEPTEPETEAPTEAPTEDPATLAHITVVGIDGEPVTASYHVGEEFTVYTVFNAATINNGKFGAFKAIQTYDPSMIFETDEVDEECEVIDAAVMSPVADDKAVAKVTYGDDGNQTGRIVVTGSDAAAARTKLVYNTDQSLLLVTHYRVTATGSSTISTNIDLLGLNNKTVTRVIKDGQLQTGYTDAAFKLFSTFTDPTAHVHVPGEPVRENVVNASCTGEGSYDEVVYCQDPDCEEPELSRETHIVAALGHTAAAPVHENEVSATCTTAGHYDEVVYCSVCHSELSRIYRTVPKLAHTANSPVIENLVPASCSSIGSYDEVVYCSVCHGELSRTVKTIAKTAHTPAQPVMENVVPATCHAAGSYDQVTYCSVCGEEILRQAKVSAQLNHEAGDAVRKNVVPATCKAAGSYDEVVYCTLCGDVISSTPKTIAKLAHVAAAAVRENEVPATCTAKGSYDEVVYCSVCGDEISRSSHEIAMLAHTPGEAVQENVVASTCSAAGSYDEVVYCTACNTELSRETKPIAKLAHTIVTDAAVAPDCTHTGLTEGSHCSVCNEVLTAQQVVSALGHDIEIHKGYAATHLTEGLSDGEYCKRCNTWVTAQVVIPMLEGGYILGDIDNSGDVDITDALFAQRHATEIALPFDNLRQIMQADVDGSGEVDIVDALFIQRYATEIATPYPIGEMVPDEGFPKA